MEDLFKQINQEKIAQYQAHLEKLDLSEATIKRRLSTLRRFYDWAEKEGYLERVLRAKIPALLGKGPSFTRLAEKFRASLPTTPTIPYLSNAYEVYHSISITKYLHYAILIIFCVGLGMGLYNQLTGPKAELAGAYPAALTRPNRYLSFQGRLTDSSNNPITTATNFVFKLYNVSTGGTALWDSGTCAITPDQDGIFSILLGSNCGTEIAATVFSENANVWLGITVGSDSEATPRIQVATVAYALNAETLQGYPADATADANTVPVINNSGNLVIAAASPTVQATSGTFSIEGQTGVTIKATDAGNGNINLTPDGSGRVIATFEASTGNLLDVQGGANIGGSGGKEANTIIYGYAGSGGSTNLNLLKLEAGASPDVKFTVDASGNASAAGYLKALTTGSYFTGDVTVSGGTITGANSEQVLVGVSNDTIQVVRGASTYTVCDSSGNCQSATGGYIGGSGTSGYVPKFTGTYTIGNSSIYDNGTNVGIGTTTPTAKLDIAGDASASGSLVFRGTSPVTIDVLNGARLDFQTSVGGDVGLTPRMTITNAGNLGIGTTAPSSLLSVGASSQFQVDSNGDVVKLKNLTYSWPSSHVSSSFLRNDGSGNLTWSTDISATSLKWNALTNPDGNLTLAHAAFTTTMGWTSTGALNAWTMNFNNNSTSATTQNAFTINNALVGSFTDTTTENLLLLQQLDTTAAGTTVVGNALKIDSAGNSNITDAIEIANSVGNITNAINIADTTGTITTGILMSGTFTNLIDTPTFDVNNAGTVTIATGQSYTGSGTVTLSSAAASALTINSGTTGSIGIGDDASAETITLGTGAAAKAVTVGSTNTTSSLTLDSGTGAINIGTSIAKTITLGNTTGATGILERVGTGNYSLDGVAGSTYTIGASTTTGTITIGGTAQTGTMTLGSSSGTNTLNIAGGSGATTLNLANVQTGGAVNIGAGMTTGTITIGGTGAQTGTIGIGTGTGAQILNFGTGGTGAKTINIGTGAVANVLTIGSTTGAASTLIQSGTGDVTLSSTDQVIVNSSKAAGGTTTEAFSIKSTVDLGAADEVFQVGDSAADFLTIRGDGKVGIGTTSPAMELDIAGDATISGTLSLGPQVEAYAGTCNATNAGKIYYDGTNNRFYYCNGTAWQEMGTGTLYSNTNASLASGSYLTVTHSKNTNDVLTDSWIYDQSTWKKLQADYTPAYASSEKNLAHNDYLSLAQDFEQSSETDQYISNLLANGLFFDTFEDSVKMAGTTDVQLSPNLKDPGYPETQRLNSSVSQAGRVGLWGGQTYDATQTDNQGNTYLGAADANDVYYYDRSQDSSAPVLVDLGIDPNWANGVTLIVDCSGSNCGNKTNLSTTYNGSLIKATGTYNTEDGYIDIEIVSYTTTTMTYNWDTSGSNYSGETGATATFGSADSLCDDGATCTAGEDTGIDVTFQNPLTGSGYHIGDRFRIASWFMEPATANDRGPKQKFPERSYLVIGDDDLDIIDADTNKFWAHFEGDANNFGGAGTKSTIFGLNGKVYLGTLTGSNAGLWTIDFAKDKADLQDSARIWYHTATIADRNAGSLGQSQGPSGMAIVNSIVNDVHAAVIPNPSAGSGQATQTMTVSGWGYKVGDVSTNPLTETVNLPYKFNDNPRVTVSGAGYSNSAPTSLASCSSNSPAENAHAAAITTTSFTVSLYNAAGAFGASDYVCYTWTATGTVSPRTYVAVATGSSSGDGGVSLINETDSSVANFTVGSQHADIVYSTKVALTNNGDLYFDGSDSSSGNYNTINVYYGASALSSDTSYVEKRSTYYHWETTPALIGANSSSIGQIYVTEGTSTIDGTSNTIYVANQSSGLSVIQEKQSGGNAGDGDDESNGSVKYYTKDYISEEMVGDIRNMNPMHGSGETTANTTLSGFDASVKANAWTTAGAGTTPNYVSGVRGTALEFDGGDYICTGTSGTCANDTDFDVTSNITLGVWIKPSVAQWGGIISKANDNNVDNSYRLLFTSARGIQFTATKAGPTGLVNLYSNGTIPLETWAHVVVTYDGSTVKIYINGTLDMSTSASGNILTTTYPTRIGLSEVSPGNYFSGSIDEPFVTAEALTAAQIRHMYEVGKRALEGSHASNDSKNELSSDGAGAGGTNAVKAVGVTPSHLGGVHSATIRGGTYAYVGLDGTSADDGWVSKIDLNSDTQVNAYTTSTDPALLDNDVTSLSAGYDLEIVGNDGVGAKQMAITSDGNDASGSFISDTITLPQNIASATFWLTGYKDSSDAGSSFTVKASNDSGSTYDTCHLIATDSSGKLPEYEYGCDFTASNNSLKVKIDFARTNTKANIYATQYGITWQGQTGFRIEQADANNVRLYNYSGTAQNLKLDVIAAGAPLTASPWTDGGAYLYPTGYETVRIYDAGGSNYLGLSHDGTNANFGINGSTKMVINSSGNVGIGTTNPGSQLHITGDITVGGNDILDSGGVAALTFDGSQNTALLGNLTMLDDKWIGLGSSAGRIEFDGTPATDEVNILDANVGIGTTGPNYKLDVSGDVNFTGALREDGVEILSGMISAFAGSCPTGWTEYTSAQGRVVVGVPSGGTVAGTVGTALSNLGTRTITDVPAHIHTVNPPNTSVSITDPGHSHSISMLGQDGTPQGTVVGEATKNWGGGTSSTVSSTTGITASVDITQFDSGSTGVASVDVTMPYIQLRYCSKNAGADIAEWIPTNEDLTDKTIVSIDPDNREKVIASRKEYDPTVVGIISTQPGWLLGTENKESVQMALAGRVPARVTLKNGEIKPGDPITTSTILGVGMKATKTGPIVGKAMEALNETSSLTPCTDPSTDKEEKCGTILVFVNISWFSPSENEFQQDTILAKSSNDYYELLRINDSLSEGDLVSLEFSQAPNEQNPSQMETISSISKTSKESSGSFVGVISNETNGNGDLLRRERVNNQIVSETRLIYGANTKVKISPTSEAIVPGDSLVVSDNLGMAAKASQAGPIIGKALESWSPDSSGNIIHALIISSWYDPDVYLTDAGDLQITKTTSEVYPLAAESGEGPSTSEVKYRLTDAAGEIIERIGAFSEAIIANLKAGRIETQELISPLVKSEQIETQRISLKEIEAEPGEDIVFNLQEASESGFGKLIVKGKEGKEVASIDAEGNVKASSIEVDSAHVLNNATVSGTLYAKRIESEEISALKGTFGELLAKVDSLLAGGNNQENETKTNNSQDEIKDHKDETGVGHDFNLLTKDNATNQKNSDITNPDAIITQLDLSSPETSGAATAEASETWATSSDASESSLSWESTNETFTDSYSSTDSGELSNALLAEAETWEITDVSQDLKIASDVTILGRASLADTSIAGSLNIGGTMSLADNSINTLTGPLYLQNLGLGGIDILAGKVVIDEQGNAVFEGNVTIKGRLALSEIEPLPDQDIVVNLAQQPTSQEGDSAPTSEVTGTGSSDGVKSGFGKLLVKGVNDEIVASIEASGTATFKKLAIANSDQPPVIGDQRTEIETNATAGQAILPANEAEITIKSQFIGENTLVYVTPISDTQNKVLFVKAKKAAEKTSEVSSSTSEVKTGWFKVAIDSPITNDIEFNWWVIN